MRGFTLPGAAALLLLVAGCVAATSPGVTRSAGGTGRIGNYEVRWRSVPSLASQVPAGLTPLMFIYRSLQPAPANGVTERDWERAAAQHGMSVSDVKHAVFGGQAYKGPDGQLRVCTVYAIQKGLCGRRPGLSVSQRAAMAQRLLAAGGNCRWVGLDPRFNARIAGLNGAETFTLYLAADCRR